MYREVVSDYPHYHSAQMKYPTNNLFNGIEVQILKGEFGLVGFLNIFSRQILNECVTFEIGETLYPFSGYIMAGGQRLQLPLSATEKLIQALSSGQTVVIYLEGFAAEISSKNFRR